MSKKKKLKIEYVDTNDMTIYENNIQLYMQEYLDKYGIDNMQDASQSQWNGFLMYLNKHIIKNLNIKEKPILTPNNSIVTNHNKYNYDVLYMIMNNTYIPLCLAYSKEISVMGFSFLIGCTSEDIKLWGDNEPTSASFKIYKTLYNLREESLTNKLVTGKQNPVGVIAMLNHHYGYNGAGTVQTVANNKLSLNDIKAVLSVKDEQQPRLTIPDNTQNS